MLDVLSDIGLLIYGIPRTGWESELLRPLEGVSRSPVSLESCWVLSAAAAGLTLLGYRRC